MGRLEAFAIAGCRCWFYSGDHGPAHFHAGKPDEWEIRVFFLLEPVEYEEKYVVRRIPGRMLATIVANATEHRDALFREWDRSQADD